jgi:hypothetical protein
MSTTRQHRLTRSGRNATTRPRTADDALSRLIANAVPPRERDYRREVHGEQEAMTAFRQARLNPAVTPRRRSMSAGKLLALKTIIAAVGLSGGGVALAGATGHLPAQAGGHPAASASAKPSGYVAAAGAADAAGAATNGHTSATPSPALHGLCHAYAAGAGNNPGKALDNPAFSALITAAGGRDKVTSYCATVVESSKPGHSPAHSNSGSAGHHTGKPSRHPTPHATSHAANGTGNSDTGSNAAHVSNKPTVAPQEQPAPHSTGKPSLYPGANS